MAQAPQYVSRAKKIDDEERTFKEKTQASMSEFQQKRKMREEQKKQAELEAKRELENKRLAYQSKTKEVLDKVHMPSEKFKNVGSDKPKAKSMFSDFLKYLEIFAISCLLEWTFCIFLISVLILQFLEPWTFFIKFQMNFMCFSILNISA